MSHLRLGDSLDKGIDMGAIVDPAQRRSVETYVERARQEGAEVTANLYLTLLLFTSSCLFSRCIKPAPLSPARAASTRLHS